MDTSGKKIVRIMAVVGIGLLACCLKLWFDTNASPSVIYKNTDSTSLGSSAASADEAAAESSAAATSLKPPEETAMQIQPSAAQMPTPEEIPVYLCGAVSKPGIYHIKTGSYLYEVIEMAGGLLPEAAADYMNLVFQFSAAVSIYIPSEEEMQDFLDGTPSSSSEYLRSGLLQGIWGRNPSGNTESSGSAAEQESVLININTADQNQLETLPGVGETTAKAIIAYREKSGGYSKIEDIMNVPGIKEGRFEAIREFITI